MVKAVEEIGGVSKLTEKELAKLGATANEAVAKMKALGLDVPPKIQAIADAAKGANEKTSLMGDIAGAIGPKLIAAFSIGAITTWASSTIDAASHIADLSSKLDVSNEAIQRWGYAAELSGASIDDVSAAVVFMNKTLAGGSDSTVAALKAAGLGFDAIRSMSPEEAFNAIVEAIQKIPDPMTQAKVATELLGKGAADLLPAIRDGFGEVGAEATIMSDEVIAANDKIGDSWTKMKGQAAVWSARLISAIQEGLAAYAGYTEQDIRDQIDATSKTIDNATNGAIARHAAGLANLVPKAGDADKALKAFNATNEENEKKINAAADAQEAHTKAIHALADTLTGKAVADKAKDLGEALKLAGGAAHLSADQTDEFFKAADTLVKGPLGANALPKNVRTLWEENGKLALGIRTDVNPALDKFYDHLYGIDQKLPELKLKTVGFLNSTSTNIIAAWQADEAAGKRAATEVEKQHKDSLKAIEDRHNQFVQTVTGYGVTLTNGLIHGWDSFKSAALSVGEDILGYFEKVFVKKMLEYFGLVETSGTSTWLKIGAQSAQTTAEMTAQQQSVSAGASVAAGATSASWIAAFASMASWALTAYLAYEFLRTALLPHHTPTTPTPTTPPPNTEPGAPQNPEPGTPVFDQNLSYAQQLFDQGNAAGGGQNVMQNFTDYMYTHPELWGHGNGFATGTHGKFLNFGAGTPVMLHGWEAVVPRAKSGAFATVSGGAELAPGNGGAVTININNPVVRERQDLDRMADLFARRLQERGL